MKPIHVGIAVAQMLAATACNDLTNPAFDMPASTNTVMPGEDFETRTAELRARASGEITGELHVVEGMKDKIAVGDTIFVIAHCAATGSLLAVIKVRAGGSFPIPFKLTGADVMHSQTSLAGKVRVEARVDKDDNALTKNPGDIVGEATDLVDVPATGVVVTFDRLLSQRDTLP